MLSRLLCKSKQAKEEKGAYNRHPPGEFNRDFVVAAASPNKHGDEVHTRKATLRAFPAKPWGKREIVDPGVYRVSPERKGTCCAEEGQGEQTHTAIGVRSSQRCGKLAELDPTDPE